MVRVDVGCRWGIVSCECLNAGRNKNDGECADARTLVLDRYIQGDEVVR
jgi:hypothetical protein